VPIAAAIAFIVGDVGAGSQHRHVVAIVLSGAADNLLPSRCKKKHF
jgi:hypothetical protein